MTVQPVNVDADKLALQGYCPVSYHFVNGPPAKGDLAFTSKRNGAVYRFGSEAGKGMFDAGAYTVGCTPLLTVSLAQRLAHRFSPSLAVWARRYKGAAPPGRSSFFDWLPPLRYTSLCSTSIDPPSRMQIQRSTPRCTAATALSA